jgi:hypothetical protein
LCPFIALPSFAFAANFEISLDLYYQGAIYGAQKHAYFLVEKEDSVFATAVACGAIGNPGRTNHGVILIDAEFQQPRPLKKANYEK